MFDSPFSCLLYIFFILNIIILVCGMTVMKDYICAKHCEHKTGVMIPEQDLDGNYIKPNYMLCTDCRLVLKKGDKTC